MNVQLNRGPEVYLLLGIRGNGKVAVVVVVSKIVEKQLAMEKPKPCRAFIKFCH